MRNKFGDFVFKTSHFAFLSIDLNLISARNNLKGGEISLDDIEVAIISAIYFNRIDLVYSYNFFTQAKTLLLVGLKGPLMLSEFELQNNNKKAVCFTSLNAICN